MRHFCLLFCNVSKRSCRQYMITTSSKSNCSLLINDAKVACRNTLSRIWFRMESSDEVPYYNINARHHSRVLSGLSWQSRWTTRLECWCYQMLRWGFSKVSHWILVSVNGDCTDFATPSEIINRYYSKHIYRPREPESVDVSVLLWCLDHHVNH
jgi:hypothetical protein